MELWDAYDENFRRVEGVSLVRGEPIPAGAYHLVCDVLVRHTDGSYLLMRRDPRKHYGGLWETTAGGSALRGEAPLDCARRELREETGIRAEELQELGRVRSGNTHYVEFLCVMDWPKDGVPFPAERGAGDQADAGLSAGAAGMKFRGGAAEERKTSSRMAGRVVE